MSRGIFKKILSLICAVLLMFTVLAACGGGNEQKQEQKTEETTTSDTEKKAEVKEEGRPLVELTLSQFSTDIDKTDEIAKDRIKKLLEEKFNIKITWHSGSDEEYYDKLAVSLSAGTAPDLFHNWGEQERTSKWIADGTIVNMGDIYEKEKDRYPVLGLIFSSPYYKMFNDFYAGDPNKIYAFYSLSYNKYRAGVMVYNGKHLMDNNLKVPETVDEFINYGKVLKSKGIIPWYFRNTKLTNWNELDKTIFAAEGTTLFGMMQDENGKWYDATISDKTKEAWKLAAGMFKDGIIDPETGTKGDWDTAIDDFVAGKIGACNFGFGNVGQYAWFFKDKFKVKYTDAKPEDMPMGMPLKGSAGYAKVYDIPLRVGMNWCIPVSCKYPDRVMDLMNYLVSDEGQDLLFKGIKGVHYTEEGGVIKFNKEEWKKEDEAYGVMDGRCVYPYFRWFANAGQFYVQYEKAGDWVKGTMDARDFSDEVYGKTPEIEYAKPIVSKMLEETYVEMPAYFNIIKYSEEENNTRVKLREIFTKFAAGFLTGQLNVDAEWDNFVKEYKAAGADQLVEAYSLKVEEAKKKFEEYSK